MKTKKKKTTLSKLKKRWLPSSRNKRFAVIALFALIVGAFGYVAITQSFAYTNAFTYYSQRDTAWANSSYPYIPGTRDQSDIKIIKSGCGPTSMAMVASTLKRKVNPAEMAAWYGTRYHTSNGTDPAVYPVFAKNFGLRYSALGNFGNKNTRALIQAVLKSPSTLVIIHASRGYFTGSGHIMVIRKYDSSKGKYLIADPNNSSNNRWFSGRDLIASGNLQNAYSFTK